MPRLYFPLLTDIPSLPKHTATLTLEQFICKTPKTPVALCRNPPQGLICSKSLPFRAIGHAKLSVMPHSRISLLSLLLLCACDGISQPGSPKDTCKDKCESRDWPLVVVHIQSKDAQDYTYEFEEIHSSGAAFKIATHKFCPELPDNTPCSMIADATLMAVQLKITAFNKSTGEAALQHTTKMVPIDACKQSIKFLEFSENESSVSVSRDGSFFPCSSSDPL